MNDDQDLAGKVEEQIRGGYERELAACEELESFGAAALDPWRGRAIEKQSPEEPLNADEILAMLFARATKTYKGAVLLVGKGYGEQAAMLNRSLFEGLAIAHWVADNERDAAERFERAARFDRHLLAEAYANTGWFPSGGSPAGPEISAEELEAMKSDFGPYGTNLWTGHSGLRAVLDEIEEDWGTEDERALLRNFERIANRDNNQLLHSTVAGLTEAITRRADGGMYLSVGPSTARIERGLFAAYWPYMEMLDLFIERFEVPVREAFDELVVRQQYEFVRLSAEQTKGVGRNDLCPCGSGVKYKRCHEGRPLARSPE